MWPDLITLSQSNEKNTTSPAQEVSPEPLIFCIQLGIVVKIEIKGALREWFVVLIIEEHFAEESTS